VNVNINLADGVPTYRQIVSQVKYLVASHLLLPGEKTAIHPGVYVVCACR
jgi:DNA-binding transcriptional regulator YhcF (GntR family)